MGDDQLANAKKQALQSLTETLADLPTGEHVHPVLQSKARGSGRENPELDRVAGDILAAAVEANQRRGGVKHEGPKEDGGITPNKVNAEDVRAIADALPQDKPIMLPIYVAYVNARNELDRATDPVTRQALVDRATLLHDIARELMLKKAPGWRDISVDHLRQPLAKDHPELNL